MLWNRWDEAVATGDVRFALRRRFHTLVDAAGLDEELARDWVVVRMVYNMIWELEDHPGGPRPRLADHVRRDRQGGPGLNRPEMVLDQGDRIMDG